MPDMEKVIRGLEACQVEENGCTVLCKANGCPYNASSTHCMTNLHKDALALLKEQEPRVMTLEEVRKSFGNPMWFECHGTYLGEKGWWCLSHGAYMPFNIIISAPETARTIRLGLADYKKVWRAWNFKPSDEQRQNTPWEDRDD